MFILKKILNSSTASPDTARVPVDNTNEYFYGDFLKMGTDGKLTLANSSELPTHYCCENLEVGKSSTILCYPITDEMVFSARAEVDVLSLDVGTKLILVPSGISRVDMVGYDEGEGNVYLYEKPDTSSRKRVLIRFAI